MKSKIITLLMFVTIAIAPLLSEPSGEQILEECLMEAHKKGFNIESDAFTEKVANAISNEDSTTMMKICPKTFKKYE